MKTAFAALVFTGLLAGTTSAQTARPDLTAMGWTFIADTADASVFMQAVADHRGEFRRVITAYDLDMSRDRDGFTFLSVRSLGEYDCTKRRTRVISETFHAQNGLGGKAWEPPAAEATEWAEPVDGSIGDIRMDFACPAAS